MPRQFPMSQKGKERLEAELLKFRAERAKVTEQLKHARSLGDLSENADWTDGKERQAIIEGKIAEVEIMLANTIIVERVEGDEEIVGLYSTVKALDLEYDDEVDYVIVPGIEADYRAGKISVESPLGRGLMGRSPGEEVDVETPGGVTKLRVLEVGLGES
ncbi:MAG: transcription elongation factor GreA [Armatimonadetes bacterium]|nr:transcription elongation factor GreA [Armatimonadota bacterium]